MPTKTEMGLDKYILDAKGEPVPEPDLMTWGKWFQTANRHVGEDFIGRSRISTVFLGLDFNHLGQGDPVLWETMVFGGKLDSEQTRCQGKREDARAMHYVMVQRVKAAESFWGRLKNLIGL